MATAELKLEIGLVDKASKGLSKITGALGTLGKAAGGLALGGLGLATAGVAGLGAALAGGISDARDAKQVMAATENVIESMGRTGQISADQIAEMAGSLSAAEGKSLFGDSDIQAGQNMLLTFANINDVLPDTTQAMVDMTQFMGGDMVSSATMLGKALDNPTQGLSALSRVGVSFSEQQKEQIKTMQEAGDMAGAQGVILDALKSQFGGAALAAAQADGGFAQFKDRMGELAENVGARVLPVLNQLMGWLNSPEVQAGITAVVDGLTTGVTKIGEVIGSVVTAFQDGGLAGVFDLILPKLQEFGTNVLNWIVEQAPKWAAQLLTWGQQFVDWVSPYIPPLLTKLGELATSAWNWITEQAPIVLEKLGTWGVQLAAWVLPQIPKLLENLGVVIGNIVMWISEQAPAIKASAKVWADELTKWIKEVAVPALVPAFLTFDAELGRLMDELQLKVGDAGEATGIELWTRLDTAMKDGLPHFRDVTLNEWSETIFTWLNETAPKVIPGAKGIAQSIIDAVKEKQAKWLPTLEGWATDIFNWLNTTADSALTWAKDVGTNMILGMVNGVKAQAASLAISAANAVLDALNAAKNALGIDSPSKVMAKEVGQPIVQGIKAGVELELPSLEKQLIRLGEKVPEWMAAGVLSQKPLLDGAVTETITSALVGAELAVKVQGAGVVNAIKQVIRDYNSALGAIQSPTFGRPTTISGGGAPGPGSPGGAEKESPIDRRPNPVPGVDPIRIVIAPPPLRDVEAIVKRELEKAGYSVDHRRRLA